MCPWGVKRCVKSQVYYVGKYRKPGNETCYANSAEKSTNGVTLSCTQSLDKNFPFTVVGKLPTECPSGSTQFQPPGEADIYPGMFSENAVSVTCKAWQDLAYYPVLSYMQQMYDYGKKDAILWAQQESLIV